MSHSSMASMHPVAKVDRVRSCLIRAGLAHAPAGEWEELAAYGLDSLLAVLTVIELQKEFGIIISSRAVQPDSFRNLKRLSDLVPETSWKY